MVYDYDYFLIYVDIIALPKLYQHFPCSHINPTISMTLLTVSTNTICYVCPNPLTIVSSTALIVDIDGDDLFI